MPEMILNFMRTLLTDHAGLLGGLVATVVTVCMALGAAKSLSAKLVKVTLEAGEWVFNRAAEKPKGLYILTAVAALVLPSAYFGRITAPERIVRVPVEVPVSDERAVKLAESGRDEAVTQAGQAAEKTRKAEETAAAWQRAYRDMESLKKDAEQKAAQLNEKLKTYLPSNEKERLIALIDTDHEYMVFHAYYEEVSSKLKDSLSKELHRKELYEAWNAKYRSADHHGELNADKQLRSMARKRSYDYHKGPCVACEQNDQAHAALDDLYKRRHSLFTADEEYKDK